jgi:hypothetical protein
VIHPSRRILLVLGSMVLALNLWSAISIIRWTGRLQAMKEDVANASNIRNGLFSIDEWKGHIQNIVSDSIRNLSFTPEEETALKAEIAAVVKTLILEADKVISKDSKSFKGKVRKAAYKALVDVPNLVDHAPRFAEAILVEVKKPENLEKLRVLALGQLNKYARKTRDNNQDRVALQKLLEKYQAKDVEALNANAGERIRSLENRVRVQMGVLFGSFLLFLGVWWAIRTRTELHRPLFALSAVFALILLVTGLSLPMIDIDARIKNVDILLLGERIQFSDQILYYRSKSILQVVGILVSSKDIDSIFVGILVLAFSVLFPVAKLLSALGTLYGRTSFGAHKVVRFFAYQSGKWSMADVMVVAIFMSYIGFTGILDDQLQDLNIQVESWQMITTNHTALQPGFIIFVAFVLFGLILSEILKRIVHPAPKPS